MVTIMEKDKNSVLEYTKRIGRSIAYGAFDAIKEQMPMTTALIENNKESAKQLYRDVLGSKQQLVKLKAMQDTYLFKPAEQALKNIKADLKSGVFYHPERAAQAEDEGMKAMMESVLKEAGMEDLMDLLNGDSDMSAEEQADLAVTPVTEVTTGDAILATVMAKEQRGATTSLVRAQTSLVESQIKTTRTIANMQFKQMQRHTSIMTAGFQNMTNGLNAIINFNNEVILQHAKNSMQFYETMTQTAQENNAILKEIVEMKRNTYRKKIDESQEGDQPGAANPFKGGVLDLKSYLDVVKSNMDNSMFGQMGMMIAGIPAMMAGIVANPLHFGAKAVATAFLGPALRMAMKGFDKSINGYLQMGLTKMAEWGKRPGTGILGELAKIFGIETKKVEAREINISRTIKEPRSWDGEDHHYLTQVIPSYLAHIEAALTGQDSRIFDMTTGKWTTSGGMARKARMQEQQLADSNLAEVRQAFSSDLYQSLNVDPKRDKNLVRQLQQGIDDLILGIQKNGGLGMGSGDMSHFRDIKANKNGEYGNQQLAEIFYNWAKSADNNSVLRQIFSSANQKVISSKQEEASRRMKGEDLTDIEKMLATNADLSAQQLKQYQLLTEALEKAKAYGDADKERELADKLRNIGASSTSVKSRGDGQPNPTSPLLRRGAEEGVSLLDWQSRIYDVLCDIRDGGGMGGGKSSRKKSKATKQQDKKKAKEDRSINPRLDAAGRPIWDEDYELLWYQEQGKESGVRASRSVGNLDNILNDKDAANAFAGHMNKKQAQLRDTELARRAQFEHGILDGVVGSDLSEKEINEKIRSNGADPNMPFLKQLAQAGSIGAKMGVISANISKITNAPRVILTSVLMQADKMMYDFMFGNETGETGPDGKPIKGLFGKMSAKMSESAQVLSDKISEAADHILKNKGKWMAKGEAFLKEHLNIDLRSVKKQVQDFTQPFKTGFQQAGKGLLGDVTGAFKGTLADLGIGHRDGPPMPGRAYGQTPSGSSSVPHPAIVSKDEAIIRPDGTGTTRVKKSGVTALSDDDLVINAKQNPWNPNRAKANLKRDAANENRIRSTVLSKMRAPGGKAYAESLPGFAKGNLGQTSNNVLSFVLNKLDEDEFKQAIEPIMGVLQQMGYGPDEAIQLLAEYVGSGAGKLGESLGLSDDEKKGLDEVFQRIWRTNTVRKNKNLQTFFGKAVRKAGYKGKLATEEQMVYEDYNKGHGLGNGIGQFAMQAMGTDPAKALEETKKYVIHNTPELMKGGMAGALIGSIFPLGGPLFGALAGSAAQVLSNNTSFMNYVFGTEVVDSAGNKSRKNDGLVSTKFVKSMEKYLPDMKKYGITGSLLGLVTPFGPMGGLMAGMAASYIKNNESARNFLFGDKGGLLDKDRKAAIKRALPSIGIGMLSTLFMGPFGLVGNAALGAGLGMLSTTEMFKKMLLGAKDRKGIRHGGLAGAIQRHITNPLKASMGQMRKGIAKWFRDDVTKPIGRGLKPIGDELKIQLKKGMKGVLNSFTSAFAGASPLAEKFFDNVFGGVRRAGGIGSWIAQQTVGRAGRWLGKGVESLGNHFRRKHLKNFQNSDLTFDEAAGQLRELGEENSVEALAYQNMGKMDSETVEAMAKQLQAVNALYDKDSEIKLKKRQAEQMNFMMSDISDVTSNAKYTENNRDVHEDLINLANQIQNAKTDSKIKDVLEQAEEIMQKARMSSEDKQRIRDTFTKAHSDMGAIRQLQKMQSDVDASEAGYKAMEEMRQQIFGGNISMDEFKKLLPQLTELVAKQGANRQRVIDADNAKAEENGDILDKNAHFNAEVSAANVQQIQELQANTEAINRLNDLISGKELTFMERMFPNGDTAKIASAERTAKIWADHAGRHMDKKDQEEFEGLRNKAVTLNADKTVEGLDSKEGIATFKEAISGKGSREVTRSLVELGKAYEMGNTAVIKNLEQILQIDNTGTLMHRVTDLTILGMEVDPSQYETINDLDDEEFSCALELVKLSVQIDDFGIFLHMKEKNPLLPEMMVKLAAMVVQKEDGSSTRIADMLIADEMENLLTDRTDALSSQYARTGSMSFVQKYLSPEDHGEHAGWFESKRKDQTKNQIKDTGLSGGMLDRVKKSVVNADITDITGKHTGFTGALQTMGNWTAKGVKKIATLERDIAIGVTDKVFDRLKPGQSLLEAWRAIQAGIEDPIFAKEGADALMQDIVGWLGRKATKGFKDQLRDRAEQITQFFASNPEKNGPILVSIFQAVRQGAISPQDAIALVDEAIAGNPINIPSVGDSDAGDTESGSAGPVPPSSNPPASSQTQATASGMPGHAFGFGGILKGLGIGAVAEGAAASASGSNSGGLLGGLFGGGDKDKKEETTESSAESEKATVSNDHLKSSDVREAAGSIAAMMQNAPVMGGGTTAPLERGGQTIIPTQYGPKLYTTSSADGQMMAAHTKDNNEVDAKERADVERKERSTGALERIADKIGGMGQSATQKVKKAGGGLFDMLKDLATAPFSMIGGLINALGGIPIIGPLFLAALVPLKNMLGKLAGSFGAKVKDLIPDSIGKGLDKGKGAIKGLVGKALKFLLGSKVGKFVALAASFLGIDLLADMGNAEASDGDGDTPGNNNQGNSGIGSWLKDKVAGAAGFVQDHWAISGLAGYLGLTALGGKADHMVRTHEAETRATEARATADAAKAEARAQAKVLTAEEKAATEAIRKEFTEAKTPEAKKAAFDKMRAAVGEVEAARLTGTNAAKLEEEAVRAAERATATRSVGSHALDFLQRHLPKAGTVGKLVAGGAALAGLGYGAKTVFYDESNVAKYGNPYDQSDPNGFKPWLIPGFVEEFGQLSPEEMAQLKFLKENGNTDDQAIEWLRSVRQHRGGQRLEHRTKNDDKLDTAKDAVSWLGQKAAALPFGFVETGLANTVASAISKSPEGGLGHSARAGAIRTAIDVAMGREDPTNLYEWKDGDLLPSGLISDFVKNTGSSWLVNKVWNKASNALSVRGDLELAKLDNEIANLKKAPGFAQEVAQKVAGGMTEKEAMRELARESLLRQGAKAPAGYGIGKMLQKGVNFVGGLGTKGRIAAGVLGTLGLGGTMTLSKGYAEGDLAKENLGKDPIPDGYSLLANQSGAYELKDENGAIVQVLSKDEAKALVKKHKEYQRQLEDIQSQDALERGSKGFLDRVENTGATTAATGIGGLVGHGLGRLAGHGVAGAVLGGLAGNVGSNLYTNGELPGLGSMAVDTGLLAAAGAGGYALFKGGGTTPPVATPPVSPAAAPTASATGTPAPTEATSASGQPKPAGEPVTSSQSRPSSTTNVNETLRANNEALRRETERLTAQTTEASRAASAAESAVARGTTGAAANAAENAAVRSEGILSKLGTKGKIAAGALGLLGLGSLMSPSHAEAAVLHEGEPMDGTTPPPEESGGTMDLIKSIVGMQAGSMLGDRVIGGAKGRALGSLLGMTTATGEAPGLIDLGITGASYLWDRRKEKKAAAEVAETAARDAAQAGAAKAESAAAKATTETAATQAAKGGLLSGLKSKAAGLLGGLGTRGKIAAGLLGAGALTFGPLGPASVEAAIAGGPTEDGQYAGMPIPSENGEEPTQEGEHSLAASLLGMYAGSKVGERFIGGAKGRIAGTAVGQALAEGRMPTLGDFAESAAMEGVGKAVGWVGEKTGISAAMGRMKDNVLGKLGFGKAGGTLAEGAAEVAEAATKDAAQAGTSAAERAAAKAGKAATAEATSAVSMVESQAEKGKGIMTKVVEVLGKVKSGILKYMPSGAKGFVEKACEAIIKKLAEPRQIATIAAKAAKSSISSIPVIGWAIGVGFVAVGALSGIRNAEEILEIPEGTATAAMKGFAAFVGAITGAPILMFLPASLYVSILLPLGKLLGFDTTDLEALRKAKKKQDADLAKAGDSGEQSKLAVNAGKQASASADLPWQRQTISYTSPSLGNGTSRGNASSDASKNEDASKVQKAEEEKSKDKTTTATTDTSRTDSERKQVQEKVEELRNTDTQPETQSSISRAANWVGDRASAAADWAKSKWNSFWGSGTSRRTPIRYGRGDSDTSLVDPYHVKQTNPLWASMNMNTPGDSELQTVGDTACGPSTYQMGRNRLFGTTTSLSDMQTMVRDSLPYKGKDDGVSEQFMVDEAPKDGMKARKVTSKAEMAQAIKDGKYVATMGQWDGGGMHWKGVFDPTTLGKGRGSMVLQDDPESDGAEPVDTSDVLNGAVSAVIMEPDTSSKGAGRRSRMPSPRGRGIARKGLGSILRSFAPKGRAKKPRSYGRGGDYKAAATLMSKFAKEKFNKDVPEWFWRTILRSESTGNNGPMTSWQATNYHNYGGMNYDGWMKEYGGTKATEKSAHGHYKGVFPDEESGLKAEVAWFCRPGADKWWTSEIEAAQSGDWEKAIKLHVAHYVQGVESVDDSAFKSSVYYSVGKEEFDGKKGSDSSSSSSSSGDSSSSSSSSGDSSSSGGQSSSSSFSGGLWEALIKGVDNETGGKVLAQYITGVGGPSGSDGGSSRGDSSSGGTSTGNAAVSDNMDEGQIWDWFRAKGYKAEATAGIMARLKQETGTYNPKYEKFQRWNGDGEVGGFGMFQWTYGDGKGYNYPDPLGKDKSTVYEKFPDSRLVKYMKWVDENKKGEYESSGNELEYLWEKDMEEHKVFAKQSRQLRGYPRASKSLNSWKPEDFNVLNTNDALLKWGMDYEIGVWGSDGEKIAKEIYDKYKDRTASSSNQTSTDNKNDDKKDDSKGKGTFGRGTRIGRALRTFLPKPRLGKARVTPSGWESDTSKGVRGKGSYGRAKSTPNDASAIWQYLKSKGLSNVSAAAVMGNFQAESAMYSDRLQNHDPSNGSDEVPVDGLTGYGLAQWTYNTRQKALKDFASSKGQPGSDWKTQIDFMMSGKDGDVGPLFQRMDETKDADKAAIIFHDDYERSADDASKKARRGEYAKKFFESEGKGQVDGNSNTTTDGGNGDSNSSSGSNGGFWGELYSAFNKAMNNSPAGKLLNDYFGDAFSFGGSGGDGGSNNSSNGNNVQGSAVSSTAEGIKKASDWAKSMVGHTGYGNNGCTEFVRNYLLKADNQVGKLMSDGSSIQSELDAANAKLSAGDKGGSLMWVPLLEQWAKDKGYFREFSKGGVEGDICVCNNHCHVIIADGKGGAWGNSSGTNTIKHYDDIAAAYGSDKCQGYIGTGAGTKAIVSSGNATRSREEMIADGGTSNKGMGTKGLGRGTTVKASKGRAGTAEPSNDTMADTSRGKRDLGLMNRSSNGKGRSSILNSLRKGLGRGSSIGALFGRATTRRLNELKSQFDQYDLSGLDEENRPIFPDEKNGILGDSITVLQAKLDNLDRLNVPKKQQSETSMVITTPMPLSTPVVSQPPAELTDPGTPGLEESVVPPTTTVEKPAKQDPLTVVREARRRYFEDQLNNRINQVGRGLAHLYGRGASTAKDSAEMWKYLKSKGLSNVSAAGVMGNFQAESSLESDIVEGGSHSDTCPRDGNSSGHADVPGYGLPQFTWSTLKDGLIEYAKSKGKQDSDWKMQIDYLFAGGKSGFTPDMLKKMDETKDPYKAALVWHKVYEKSADSESQAARRGEYAKKFFESEGKGQVDGDSSLNGTTDSSSGGDSSSSSSESSGFWGELYAAFNKALTESPAGKLIKDYFGDAFSFGGSGGSSGNGNSNSSGGGGSTDAGIKKASEWANGMVGKTGFGNNGCTEFVRQYLVQADNQVGKLMTDGSSITSELQAAEAKLPAEDKGRVTLMWVPTLAQWAKDKGLWKEMSEGGAEGDIGVCRNHGHVVISDGKGGYWGNSSSLNQIVHKDSFTSDYSQCDGYVKTGSGSSTVSTGKYSRTKEEEIADAGSTNAGKGTGKGKGTLGRGETTKAPTIEPMPTSIGDNPEADNSRGLDIKGYATSSTGPTIKGIAQDSRRGKGPSVAARMKKAFGRSMLGRSISAISAGLDDLRASFSTTRSATPQEIAARKVESLKKRFDEYDLSNVGLENQPVFPDAARRVVGDSFAVLEAKLKNLDRLNVPKKLKPSPVTIASTGSDFQSDAARKREQLKAEFSKYDLSTVDEENRPNFPNPSTGDPGDSFTVLRAKLDNLDRLGVPKKQQSETSMVITTPMPLSTPVVSKTFKTTEFTDPGTPGLEESVVPPTTTVERPAKRDQDPLTTVREARRRFFEDQLNNRINQVGSGTLGRALADATWKEDLKETRDMDLPNLPTELKSTDTKFGITESETKMAGLGRASVRSSIVKHIGQNQRTVEQSMPTIMAKTGNAIDNLPKERLQDAASSVKWNEIPAHNQIQPTDSAMTKRSKIKAAMKAGMGSYGRGQDAAARLAYYQAAFSEYDVTNVNPENLPVFPNEATGEPGDSFTVLQAKLDNLDRLGVPRKGEEQLPVNADAARKLEQLKAEFSKYDLSTVDEENRPNFPNPSTGDPGDSFTVLRAKLDNLDRLGVPRKGAIQPVMRVNPPSLATPIPQAPSLTNSSYTELTGIPITGDGVYRYSGTISGEEAAAIRRRAYRNRRIALGTGKYGRVLPLIAGLTLNFIRPHILRWVARRYGPMAAQRISVWIGTNFPRIKQALEGIEGLRDIMDVCEVIWDLAQQDIPDLVGLAANVAERGVEAYAGHRGIGRGSGSTPLTDQEIDSIEDRQTILKEFDKYDLSTVLRDNWPTDKDDMSVLRAKLKKVVKMAKLKPSKDTAVTPIIGDAAYAENPNAGEEEKPQPKKRRKNFLEKGWDALTGIWKRTQGTIGDALNRGLTALQPKTAEAATTTVGTDAKPTKRKYTDFKAPNGLYIEQNDVDYLMNEGKMSEHDAIMMLSKDKKYTEPVDPKVLKQKLKEKELERATMDRSSKGSSKLTDKKAPNGLYYEKNDVDFLMSQPWCKSEEQAYAILSKEKKYTQKATPEQIREQRRALAEARGGTPTSRNAPIGTESERTPSLPPSTLGGKLTGKKAPNGLEYEQRDVDFMLAQGMTEEEAYEALSKEEKYTKRVSITQRAQQRVFGGVPTTRGASPRPTNVPASVRRNNGFGELSDGMSGIFQRSGSQVRMGASTALPIKKPDEMKEGETALDKPAKKMAPPMTDEEIEAATDRKVLLAEFDKYDLSTVPKHNHPDSDGQPDSLTVLKAKLKMVKEQAKLKPTVETKATDPKTGKPKRRKNFLEKGWDALTGIWKRAQGTVGDWLQKGAQMGSPTGATASTKPASTKQLTDKKAPNGLYYEKNDVDYLLKQGMTEEQAYDLLSKHEKYTKEATPEQIKEQEQAKKAQDAKTGKRSSGFGYADDETIGVGPNGLVFEKNDVDYLMNQGLTREQAFKVLEKHEKYTKPADPKKLAEQRKWLKESGRLGNLQDDNEQAAAANGAKKTKPQKPKGFFDTVTESLGNIFGAVGEVFGIKPKAKPINERILTTVDGHSTASTKPASTKQLTDKKAPNGLYYEKNDVDYLLKQGMTEEQAYDLLSKHEKYTKEATPEQIKEQEQAKKAQDAKTGKRTAARTTRTVTGKPVQSATPRANNQRISNSVVRGQKKAKAVNAATRNGTKVDKVVDQSTKPGEVGSIAPNGKPYEENDIKYLMDNGYTREDAITTLSKHEKYAKRGPTNPVEAQLQAQAKAKQVEQKRAEAAKEAKADGVVSSLDSEKVDALLAEQKQTNQLLNAILQAIVSNGQAVTNAMASKPDQASNARSSANNPYAVAAGAKSILDASLQTRSGMPGYMTSVMGNHTGGILSFLDVASRPN